MKAKQNMKTNLRRSSNVTSRQPNIQCPCDVSDPVSVTLQRFLLYPALRIFSITPNFDEVVTTCTGEAFNCLRGCGRLAGNDVVLLRRDKRAWLGCGGP